MGLSSLWLREAVAEAIESHCVAVDERVESNRENVSVVSSGS